MTQKYKAGDKVTIELADHDAAALNANCAVYYVWNRIISHEPAPIPEPFVVWTCRNFVGELFASNKNSFNEFAEKIQKLTLTPTSHDGGTYTVEKVK